MATIAQSRVLSTPAIYVSGVLVKVVPNSAMMKIPGEVNVRAMSAGGGVVDIVAGVNAEKLIAEVSWEMAATAENVAAIRAWRNNGNQAISETVRVVELADQYSFDQMYLSNEPDVHFKSDGNIKVDWRGRYVP
jgi:hypothetical protein